MGRHVLGRRLLDDCSSHLGHVVDSGRTNGKQTRKHRPNRDFIEQIEVLLIDLLAVEFVDIKSIVDLHARITRSHEKIATIRSPGAGRYVFCFELHDPLAVRIIPDEDISVEIAEALLDEILGKTRRREAADGREATRATCLR